jgi:hypothetical protein
MHHAITAYWGMGLALHILNPGNTFRREVMFSVIKRTVALHGDLRYFRYDRCVLPRTLCIANTVRLHLRGLPFAYPAGLPAVRCRVLCELYHSLYAATATVNSYRNSYSTHSALK